LAVGGFILAVFTAAKLGLGSSYDFRRAFSIILLFAYLHYIGMTVILWIQLKRVLSIDRGIVNTVTLTLPFFLLAVIHFLMAAYWRTLDSYLFSTWEPNVYIQAFMLTVPEFIIALILLACGTQLAVIGKGPIPIELTVEEAVRLGWPEIRIMLPSPTEKNDAAVLLAPRSFNDDSRDSIPVVVTPQYHPDAISTTTTPIPMVREV
jgi:hypothetical protein